MDLARLIHPFLAMLLAEPAAPSALAPLALSEGRNTLRQCLHDLVALVRAIAEPPRDLVPGTPAADAEAGFRVDHADLDARRFDFERNHGIHGPKIETPGT